MVLSCAVAVFAAAACFALAGRASAAVEHAAPGTAEQGAGQANLGATLPISTNCRYGVYGEQRYLDWIAAQKPGIGWNLDFGHNASASRLAGSEYVNVVRVQQSKDARGKRESGPRSPYRAATGTWTAWAPAWE